MQEIVGVSEKIKRRRLGWDEFFLYLCKVIADTRSPCIRRPTAAIIVKNYRILSVGWNGPPEGDANCIEVGCLRENAKSGEDLENCRALGLHAENNALYNAARIGVPVYMARMYTLYSPCKMCCAAIKNAGIGSIVYWKLYEGFPEGPLWLIKHGISVKQVNLPDDLDRH